MKPIRVKFKYVPSNNSRFLRGGSREIWFKRHDGLAQILPKDDFERATSPAIRIKPGEVVRWFKRIEATVPRIGQYVMRTNPGRETTMNGDYLPRPYWDEGICFKVVGYCRAFYDRTPLRKTPITLDELILEYYTWDQHHAPKRRVHYLPIRECSVVSARPLLYPPEPLDTVAGGWWNVPRARFYVFAKDTFMSGWGQAVHEEWNGRTNPKAAWVLFPCDSVIDAKHALDNVRRRPEMEYVGVCRSLSNYGGSNRSHESWGHHERTIYLKYRKVDPTKRMRGKNMVNDWLASGVVKGQPFLLYTTSRNHVTIMHKERCPNWYRPHMGRDHPPAYSVDDAREHMAALIHTLGDH
jgi:hypothetical protein